MVNGDTTVEPDETFVVNLSSPSGATIADSQGQGTIVNDDFPQVSIDDVSVTEGNAGTKSATFTVTLSAASASTVTVDWATADVTASAASDYEGASGTLTFSAGTTSLPLPVTVKGDTAVEPDETFVVNLSSPSGVTIADGQGQGTILNDDGAAPAKAEMQSPPPGSTLASATATFTWSAGVGVTSYWLYVGTTHGGSQIYPGVSTTALSATVNGIPTNGATVYVRLWSRIGGTWVFNDYTYMASGTASAKAQIQTPVPGTTLPGSSVTFNWNTGSGVTSYWLYVGTTPGGSQIYPGANTTTLSATVNGIPTNGATVYVRLWSRIGGTWVFNDYTYTASGTAPAKAEIQTPVPGTTLPGASATFTWNPGSGVSSYWLYVGTTQGGSQVYPGASTTALSATVNGIPTNGAIVYVRLWSKIGGTWVFNDYTYTASGTTPAKAEIQTPVPGTTLPGASVTFAWNTGSGVSSYWLYVGTTQGGNQIFPGASTTALSATVNGIPTNGATVYVRLWSRIGGTWVFNDYTYTAAGP
jgi:hypothetical protein